MSAASGVEKYPCLFAHPWIVRTTRPINCLTLRSRSGVPRTPRKYLETTTLVATCDQVVGISTSCCSKTTSPFSLVMEASRVSHWTSSNGATPGRVKYRFQGRPFRLRFEVPAGTAAGKLGRSVDVFWVDRAGGPRAGRRHPTYMGAGFALPVDSRLLRRPAWTSVRLARQIALAQLDAVARVQKALAHPDRLRRHLDQLVILDEVEALLE